MKRIIMVSLVLATGVLIVYAGPMLDMLQGKKAELLAQKQQLERKKGELGGVYNQLNTELLGGIDKTINDMINSYISAINASKNSIANIPQAGLAFAGIGDIGAALDSIKNVLEATKSTLEKVRDRFKPVVANLSPANDPKEIYKGFDSAIADMDKAAVAMNRVEEFLAKLGL
jgi:hypothetical protein